VCIYIYMYVCICLYIYICVSVYVYVCVNIYMQVYAYVYICIYNVYVYVCLNIYMQVYAYVYICIYMVEYVCVCVWTHVNICEGPYQPLRFGRRGCCFYKSMSTKSDWYTASPYRLVDPQLPHSSDREYYIPLSESVTAVYPPQVVPSCTPTLRTHC